MESDVAIFSDKGNYLIIEALECFKSGLLEATMVMLRAAIDTALFILTKNKLYKDKASRLRGMSPLFDTSVVDLECVFKIGTVWGKLRSLMKKSGLSDKEINTIIKNLENAREKGNFSAHFYVNHIKDSQKYLEKYNKMKEKALSSEDESKWFEENKQKPHYITYHDAKEAIENSISSLMKLRECAMKDADMIKQD